MPCAPCIYATICTNHGFNPCYSDLFHPWASEGWAEFRIVDHRCHKLCCPFPPLVCLPADAQDLYRANICLGFSTNHQIAKLKRGCHFFIITCNCLYFLYTSVGNFLAIWQVKNYSKLFNKNIKITFIQESRFAPRTVDEKFIEVRRSRMIYFFYVQCLPKNNFSVLDKSHKNKVLLLLVLETELGCSSLKVRKIRARLTSRGL